LSFILQTSGLAVPRIGIDLNPSFVSHCEQSFGSNNGLSWHVADATKLHEWWCEMGYDKYKRCGLWTTFIFVLCICIGPCCVIFHSLGRFTCRPLVTMVNNTVMIMPEEIRGVVCQSMMKVAGNNGV
jgi:hypothetical protein